MAVVCVARKALEGLRGLALRRWDLGEEERDLRVLLRRLRHVEVLRDLKDCRRRWGLEGLAAKVAICGAYEV